MLPLITENDLGGYGTWLFMHGQADFIMYSNTRKYCNYDGIDRRKIFWELEAAPSIRGFKIGLDAAYILGSRARTAGTCVKSVIGVYSGNSPMPSPARKPSNRFKVSLSVFPRLCGKKNTTTLVQLPRPASPRHSHLFLCFRLLRFACIPCVGLDWPFLGFGGSTG